MASLAFHVLTTSSSTKISQNSSNHEGDAKNNMSKNINNNNNNLFFMGNKQSLMSNSFKLKANNVATRFPPLIASPTPKKGETNNGGKLSAWTSITQERWEGELHVQGQIPSWLVCFFSN